ncbi:MAG: BCAM0308 family protein [Burkholderiaceae bacterium]|nr:BCAM0308 family protein [Burkholderiaceae bacterium]
MKTKHGGWREEYRQEYVHDAYKQQKKLPEPTRCPDCGAVFREGRWQWEVAPAGANEALCPACHRIRDRYPAGYVTLKGEFFAAHREEILRIARNCETREKAEHPLERIMEVEDLEDGVQITTTDAHLARAIGEAVHDAYKGELEVKYSKEENLVRVYWSR